MYFFLSLFTLLGLSISPVFSQAHPEVGEAKTDTVLKVDASIVALIEAGRYRDAGGALEKILDRDPDHLEAHYYRAICHRELAQNMLLNLNKRFAINHFEFILERDSSFQDVMHQYALLRRNYEEFERAIRYEHIQLRLHPDQDASRLELFNIYDHYVHTRDPLDALAWLREQDNPYASFSEAEALRLSEQWEGAEQVLTSLLDRPRDFPPQPIYLALARILYTLDRPLEAQAYIQRAIDEIDGRLAADFVFDDMKFLFNEEELQRYNNLTSAGAFVSFFETFWTRRDPMPARLENVRLTEHYRRLRIAEQDYSHYGLRTWHTNPDELNNLQLPPTHALNVEFNDMGLIFVRHGPPQDQVRLGGYDHQAWRYRDPDMDFHFNLKGSGNNWRLTPVPPFGVPSLYDDLQMWGGLYTRLGRAGRMERYELEHELIEQSREATRLGLNSDQHTWSRDIEPLEFPFVVATFRGMNNRTRLEVHQAIPKAIIKKHIDIDVIEVETGISIQNSDWISQGEHLQTSELSLEGDSDSALLEVYELELEPSTYHISLHARIPTEQLLGGYEFENVLPDYYEPVFAMSDLLPASRIRVTSAAAPHSREDLELVANPTRIFDRESTLFFYFELYFLTLDASDLARYTVEYTLTPEEQKRSWRRFFRKSDQPALSLTTTHTATTTSPVEYVEIDAGKVSTGTYTLTATITDTISGSTAEKSIQIELVD